MATETRWNKTSWSWELEIVVVFFVFLAMFVPLYIEYTTPVIPVEEMSLIERSQQDSAFNAVSKSQGQQQNMVIGLSILGLYVGYLVISLLGNRLISTSFFNIHAPVVFAGVAYYRLLTYTQDGSTDLHLVSGTWWEPIVWILGVYALCLLLSKLRKIRHMKYFNDENWTLTMETAPDPFRINSLKVSVRSFVYPPTRFYVSENGILAEGWFFILPFNFKNIKSIIQKKSVNSMANDYIMATRRRDLLRIQLSNDDTPYIISPVDTDQFLKTCNEMNPANAHLFTSDSTHHATKHGE